MYDIFFNGAKAWDLGIAVATRPSVPPPQMRGSFVDVAGLDGSLLVTDNTYENIEIEIEMNFARKPEWLGNTYRAAKNWLTGSGELILGDDPEVYYRVKMASVSDMERRTRFGADIKATFICDPFTYFLSGKHKQSVENVLLNPYYLAKPIYHISGEGVCDLTVNGKTMRANVGQHLAIDTEKMLSYKNDGTLNNADVTGDYEDLFLKNGENTITITNGFTLEVIPNWRSL